jgi:hypothetical protein
MAQVTIKVLRKRGGVITWCYDSPEQCRDAWRTLCDTGATHDTKEPIERASYFEGESLTAKKMWEAASGEAC